MTVNERVARVSLLAGIILAVGGCGQPLRPMQFNNRIAKSNLKLSEGAKRFYKGLEPLSKGGAADQATAKAGYDDVTNALRDIKKDFDTIIPPGDPAASDLMAKYQAFLKAQQSIYDNAITPMWNIVQDNGRFPDPGAKWLAISPLLARASGEERSAMDALRKSQQDYCQYYKLEPK